MIIQLIVISKKFPRSMADWPFKKPDIFIKLEF
jgi:hypothetical protein